jgi:hypothetical protein
MQKRGALFYIIDAFVAAGIIAITLTVVFSVFLNAPKNEYNTEALTNYYTFFEKTRINNAPGTTARELIRNGTVSNPRANLFATITGLVANGRINDATAIIAETTNVALEPHYGASFTLINTSGQYELYSKDAARKNQAKFLLIRRTASSFKREPRVTTMYVPIAIGQTGEEACAPATCLYVTDTVTIDAYGCPNVAGAGWQARCRTYEPEALFGPVIYEVAIWT